MNILSSLLYLSCCLQHYNNSWTTCSCTWNTFWHS